ncbi:hypothetical protein DA482_27830 [Pseudomonas fluorescens]|nr:hypothetical protein D0N73_03475 [Pseudomonas fluorescens]TWR47480.1 hypothetical protein FIP59_10595 [Pseudomonas fluorescens]
MWKRACSRIQWISQPAWRLTHRLREQARAYIRSSHCSRNDQLPRSPLPPRPPAFAQQLIHKATHSNCGQVRLPAENS